MHLKELTTAHFQAAEEGTTTEINGNQVEIDGYFVSEDNSTAIPCLRMMSDFRWVLICLISRLFHPDTYAADGEDVPQVIEKEINQLISMTPDEQKNAVKKELETMKEYVNNLSEAAKPEAEQYIINATSGTVRSNAK